MDIGSTLILLGVAVCVAAFVFRPLVEKPAAAERLYDRRASALQAELDRVLATIQELEMDFAMEKIDAADHQAQRAALAARGASLMRQRDELSGGAAVGQEVASLEALVEAEVARLREAGASPAGFCGGCGQPAEAGDRFCVRCGAALGAQEMRA